MEIITISPRGFGANTYAMTEDGKTAILIDPAQTRVESELIKRGLLPAYVLLTHCHFDHVGGVSALQASGARVLCSAAEKPLKSNRVSIKNIRPIKNKNLCPVFECLLTKFHAFF